LTEYDDKNLGLTQLNVGEMTMEAIVIVLMCLIAAELFMVLSNLSKLRVELTQRYEKLSSQPSETKKSPEK
jgi:hypothetical protein